MIPYSNYLSAVITLSTGSAARADHIGEAEVGTNYGITKFTKNMLLFDEKIGGTIHIALGTSFPETGGLNESAVHWDILKDMKKDGEIYADGKLCYKNGKFVI